MSDLPAIAPDFGKAAADYARHRQGYPPRFYAQLAAHGVGLAGQRVVDVGTGTGTVARALAARGCTVTGVDRSADLLAQARALDPSITWTLAHAEATGLPGAAWDAVTASQCWHWFDRPRAAAEARRLLAPRGALAIMHLDWCSDGGVVDDTLALIAAHSAPVPTMGLGRDGVYPWAPDLRAAGFRALDYFGFDCALVYSHEAWRGRIRASAMIGPRLAPDAIRRFDDALAARLAAKYPDPVATAHRVYCMIARMEAP